MCSYLDLLSPFLGTSISFINSTQWSCQVKDGSLSVSDICSPSNVISIQCNFPRKYISLLRYPAVVPEDVGPKVCT
jgi:hypothetical protein